MTGCSPGLNSSNNRITKLWDIACAPCKCRVRVLLGTEVTYYNQSPGIGGDKPKLSVRNKSGPSAQFAGQRTGKPRGVASSQTSCFIRNAGRSKIRVHSGRATWRVAWQAFFVEQVRDSSQINPWLRFVSAYALILYAFLYDQPASKASRALSTLRFSVSYAVSVLHRGSSPPASTIYSIHFIVLIFRLN